MLRRRIDIDRLELLVETSNPNIVDEIVISNIEYTGEKERYFHIQYFPSKLEYIVDIDNIDDFIFTKNRERINHLYKLTNIKMRYMR